MKYWIQILSSGNIQASHLWDSSKPFSMKGLRRLVIDKKGGEFHFLEVHPDGSFFKETRNVGTAVEGDLYEVYGKQFRLIALPETAPVAESDIAGFRAQPIDVPLLAQIDRDEVHYRKVTKYTFVSGLGMLMALFLGTMIQGYFQETPTEEELIAEKKVVSVKLKNAPSPAVVAAAYEKAMKQGALQAKKIDNNTPKKPGPKTSPVSNIKNAFASLLGGGLSAMPNRGTAPKAGADHVAALLPGVQGSGAIGRAGQRSGGSKGDSLVQVAMSGSGDGGYQVGGDAAGVGIDGVAGQGNGWLSLNLTDALIDEGLSRDEVGRVIHGRISEIRYCYESSMLRKPDIEGKLIIDFTIASSGRVRSANVKESSVRDERLNECILKRLARWEFPKPKSGVEVAVSYPFIFKRLRR